MEKSYTFTNKKRVKPSISRTAQSRQYQHLHAKCTVNDTSHRNQEQAKTTSSGVGLAHCSLAREHGRWVYRDTYLEVLFLSPRPPLPLPPLPLMFQRWVWRELEQQRTQRVGKLREKKLRSPMYQVGLGVSVPPHRHRFQKAGYVLLKVV